MLSTIALRLITAREHGKLRNPFEKDYYLDPQRGLHGKHPPEHRFRALRRVLDKAAGRSVLDLGCAEGLIAEQFVKAGARELLGIDRSSARVAIARRLVGGNARFEAANLADWDSVAARPWLKPCYDIVLFLGLYQHLPARKRIKTLLGAAQRCGETLAVRMPNELLSEADGVLRDENFMPVLEIGATGLGLGRFRIYERFKWRTLA